MYDQILSYCTFETCHDNQENQPHVEGMHPKDLEVWCVGVAYGTTSMSDANHEGRGGRRL